ncbi:MAG: tetratricopeptide repeat protein [Gemmatimonadetes bacterium]|nr:tetratricopeptide repeat protein [Gemmatimonadota bacterium]
MPRSPGAGRRRWPLILGAAALLVVVLVLMLPRRVDRAGAPEVVRPASGAAPVGSGAPVPGDGLLSSDMRTNADRLFNRVMGAAQQGDRAEVSRFAPMAIQAYGLVEDLDDDGVLHLAMLHLTAGDPARAQATASRILRDSPDHILALGVAAAAARRAGDEAEARTLYRRLLDGYPQEAVKPRPEYVDHQAMLPEYRRIAREALGESEGG